MCLSLAHSRTPTSAKRGRQPLAAILLARGNPLTSHESVRLWPHRRLHRPLLFAVPCPPSLGVSTHAAPDWLRHLHLHAVFTCQSFISNANKPCLIQILSLGLDIFHFLGGGCFLPGVSPLKATPCGFPLFFSLCIERF